MQVEKRNEQKEQMPKMALQTFKWKTCQSLCKQILPLNHLQQLHITEWTISPRDPRTTRCELVRSCKKGFAPTRTERCVDP